MRKLTIIFFCLWVCNLLHAQDGHYTQFYQNPLYLNPALIGDPSGAIRLGGIYRTQWQSVEAPYTNYGVFGDMKV